MNSKIYIGIDNGISGALVTLLMDGKVEWKLTPIYTLGSKSFIDDGDVGRFLSIFKDHEINYPVHVILEQGQLSPFLSSQANYSMGYSFGVMNTLLRMLRMKYTLVNPQTWQKEMFKDVKGLMKTKANPKGINSKEASIEMCKRLFPEVSLLATPRSKKPHDGIADALMMAEYGRRMNL